jgi:hypothetical protein
MVNGQRTKVLMFIVDSCLGNYLQIQSFLGHRNNLRFYNTYLLMLSSLISSVRVVISYYNIKGVYDTTYIQVESVAICVLFLAYVLQLQTGYLI